MSHTLCRPSSLLSTTLGHLPWADIFKPAVYYARNGYPVTERIHDYCWHRAAHVSTNKTGNAICLHNGLAPAVGEMFRNEALADTLSLISRDGPDAFYRGQLPRASCRHRITWEARWPPPTLRSIKRSGSPRSRPPIAARPCMRCHQTRKAWPRSPC